MKKYYDAMYRVFNHTYELCLNCEDKSIKRSRIADMYEILGGVLEVAVCDDEITPENGWYSILHLRTHLYDVARIYFLVE